MLPSESLLARIRGEYREMPGLRLTSAQARRLWQLDAGVCQAILTSLIQEGFLTRTADGAFVANASAAPSRDSLARVSPSRRMAS
jgi:hypothetical protein